MALGRSRVATADGAAAGSPAAVCSSRAVKAGRAVKAAASTARGRRGGQGAGGQGAGGQSSGATGQQQSVPATVSLHVESTFRGGRLVLARGSDATTTHDVGGDVASTVRWTLTAL